MEALGNDIDTEKVAPQLLCYPLGSLVLTWKSMCSLDEMIGDHKNIHRLFIAVFSQ